MAQRHALISVSIVALLFVAEATAFVLAVPQLRLDLDASETHIQWILDSYTLVFAILVIPAGALADRLGSRRVYVVGLAMFAAASGAGIVANSVHLIIAARVLTGLGAALATPAMLPILRHHFEGPRLYKAIGTWTASGGLGGLLGLIGGGAAIGFFGWRSIFAVSCVVALVSSVVAPSDDGRTSLKSSAPVDWVGLGVLTVFAVSATTGIVAAGQDDGNPLLIVLMLAVSVAVILIYASAQARLSRRSISSRALMVRYGASVYFAMVWRFIAYYVSFSTAYLSAVWLQEGNGYSALQSGMISAPIALGFIISGIVSPRLEGLKLDDWPYPFGVGALVIALGASSFTSPAFVLLPSLIVFFVFGLAHGALLVWTSFSVANLAPPDYVGSAAGLLISIGLVGGAAGVAVSGSVLSNQSGERISGAASTISTLSLFVLLVVVLLPILSRSLLTDSH